MLSIKNNKAKRGGGLWLGNSTFQASNASSLVLFDSNSAEDAGGGIFCTSGGSVLVSKGATMEIKHNKCRNQGAGIMLKEPGTRLIVIDAAPFKVINNTITRKDENYAYSSMARHCS